jgi:putative Mg2+ transporter-C (MgtC) family protein
LQAELLGRLLVAIVLGGVLGWERQLGQHPAGLRTHILVTLGAAAYTIAGTYGVAGNGTVQDAGRIAAQIVAGVGFLGAGTIWRSGSDRVIYGLTTAASIWVAASIGMLTAFGLYVLATGCAVLGFAVLRLLKGFEEAPLRVALPRLRARSGRRPAEGAEIGLPAGVGVGGPTYGQEPVSAGILSDGQEQEEAPGQRLHVRASSSAQRKARRKKAGKDKRRDAELESMAHISDAPPHLSQRPDGRQQ